MIWILNLRWIVSSCYPIYWISYIKMYALYVTNKYFNLAQYNISPYISLVCTHISNFDFIWKCVAAVSRFHMQFAEVIVNILLNPWEEVSKEFLEEYEKNFTEQLLSFIKVNGGTLSELLENLSTSEIRVIIGIWRDIYLQMTHRNRWNVCYITHYNSFMRN